MLHSVAVSRSVALSKPAKANKQVNGSAYKTSEEAPGDLCQM